MTTDVIPDAGKENENTAETAAASSGPGRQLREAREALGLSQADICRQLHLEPKIVTAIEADDYRNLPPRTFVIGYLRNYARQVNLPAEAIVAGYERLGFAPQPVRLDATREKKSEHRSDKAVRITSYLLALAVIVLLAVWWQYQENIEPPSQPQSLESAIPGEIHEEPAAPSAIVPAPIAPSAPATPSAPEAPAASPEATAEQMTTTPAPSSQAPAPSSTAGVNKPPVPAAASLDSATVQLRFESDSWVEINDANGKRLFFATGKTGEVKTLKGPAPFDVVLGNAPGVKIEYNGSPFDLKPYTRGTTASFTLGVPENIAR
ncbi:MAG: DUF4115 domain-containing protein [Gammaproteobacteria bacterium]|nr:DUF4115 domain-containing protein [Gammaproteobacteria bacterium]